MSSNHGVQVGIGGSGGVQHAKRSRKGKNVVKLLFMIPAAVLVFNFQVNRPKVLHTYRTSDPSDNTRHGINYTCGCAPLTSIQGQQNSSNGADLNPGGNSSLNGCYESSALQTVSILMYSNFKEVGALEQILENAYSSEFTTKKKGRTVEGFQGSKQAHDISWNNDTFLHNLSAIYLGSTAKQRQLKVSIDYLQNKPQNAPFLDFPTSYISLALAFNCSNCTLCSLLSVNEIFSNISGNLNHTWGQCAYWNEGNQCGGKNYYVAKCVMYPTGTIPLNFAVDTFLQRLTNMSGVDYVHAPEDFGAINQASFGANVLYMNFSRATGGFVQLNFFELQKYSAAWLPLLGSFPTLDSECSQLERVEVCNGTSICNVFNNDGTHGYEIRSITMSNKLQCEHYIYKNDPYINVTVDAEENLWPEFNISRGNWSSLMCIDYKCTKVPPYQVLWETSRAMENNSLNQFLELNILSNLWARTSGVCINTYTNVVRQSIVEGDDNVTAFFETKCHEGGGYCWLTGRYRQLTDIPGQNWHKLPSHASTENQFLCYNLRDQAFYVWVIITFGVLFGWLGSVDLLFNWGIFPLVRYGWDSFNKFRAYHSL